MQELKPILELLREPLVDKLTKAEHTQPYDIAISLWCFATLGDYSPRIFMMLLQRAMALMPRLSPTDLAHLMWACAKVDHKSSVIVLDAVATTALEKLPDFEPREIAQLLWGMYHTKIYDAALLRACVVRLKAEATFFQSSEIVMCMYTFTRFKYLPAKKSGMYQAALSVLLEPSRQPALNTQDVSNTLWALARASIHVEPAQLDTLAELALQRVSLFSPQELACTAYAFGKMQHSHPVLMQAVSQRALHERSVFSNQELCLVLWALSKLGISPGEQQLAAFASEFGDRMPMLPPLTISNMIKAFAKLQYTPNEDLMNQISIEACRRMGDFHMAELSNLLWAYQQLMWQDLALCEVAEEFASDNMHLCSQAHVASMVTSLRGVSYQPEALITAARTYGIQV